MRHKGVKKEETRQKVVDAASRGFRKNGYAGIGVEGLSKIAGVTVGSLYGHFGSKSGAFDIAVSVGLDEVIEALPEFQAKHGNDWFAAFADYYLSEAHRLDLECGCAMASLTPEVVRADPGTQGMFEEKMQVVVDLMSAGFEGVKADERQARAWGVLGTLIGGLNLSRAVKNKQAANEIAQATKAAAIEIASQIKQTP